MMRKDKRNCFRNRLSQTVCKFWNIFTVCSRQPTTCLVKTLSYSSPIMISTPAMIRRQRNIYFSTRLKLSFHPTSLTSIDRTRQNKPVSSSSSSSSSSSTEAAAAVAATTLSSSSNCQSSLTIHQYYSTSMISSLPTSNIEIVNTSSNMMEHTPTLPPTSSHFSYLIRPTTPCIFGRETYDDDSLNDDEFFLTAGGIVHSCPNIYELSNDTNRKLQSCDHLIFLDQQSPLVNHSHLNCYDTELDRYSILPRFPQPLSSSISTDSINSELELYKERHAVGLCRQYHNHTSTYSSFLPTTWKSDNYLFFMPFLNPHSSVCNSIDHGQRSRSHDTSIEQTCPSILA